MFSPKNLLFIIALVLIAGIVTGYYIFIPADYSIVTILIILFVVLCCVFLKDLNRKIFILLLLLVSVFIFGWLKISVDYDRNASNTLRKLYGYNDKIIVQGFVEERAVTKHNRLTFPVKIKKIIINNRYIDLSFSVLFNVRLDTSRKEIKEFRYGDEVFAAGKLLEPKNARNPGEFDYSKYLALKDINAIFRVNNINEIICRSENNGEFFRESIIEPIRENISKYIETNMGAVEGAFLKGLLVGDRSGIPDDIKDDFQNAGVTHVLAVSGLNVVFVILIFYALYSVFIKNKTTRTILIIISLIFYMFLAGNTPSIVRATIMGTIFLAGNAMERKTSAFNMLSLSAIVILVIDSRQLFDLGFQLSFLCVFSLIYVYPVLSNNIFRNSNNKAVKIFKESVLGSFAVLIMLFPLIAMASGRVSLITIIANIFVVPFANASLAIGFLQVMTSNIMTNISMLLSGVNQFILWLNLCIINYFGNLDFLSINAYGMGLLNILLYYGFCFGIIYSVRNRKIVIGIITLLVTMNVMVWKQFVNNDEKKLKITFIDAGQGDASLLQLPEGKNVLIDVGPKIDGYDSGEKIIYPFLMREGIKKIDVCFISHFHDDHYGGLPFLIKNKMIDTIYYQDSTGFGGLCNYLDSLSTVNSVMFRQIDSGIMQFGNLSIYQLNRHNDYVMNTNSCSRNSRDNNSSMVMKIYYGNINMLFMGDAEEEVDNLLGDRYKGFLKSDILKVAHHGSKSGASEKLLDLVSPRISVVFAGLGNKFGFPSKKVLERLYSRGSAVIRTDLDRAIILETDGNTIERIRWN